MQIIRYVILYIKSSGKYISDYEVHSINHSIDSN